MNLYRHVDRTRLQFDFLYFGDRTHDYDREIEELGGLIYRLPETSNPIVLLFRTLSFLRSRTFETIHVHTLFHGGIFLLGGFLAGVRDRVFHAHATTVNQLLSKWGRLYQKITIRLGNIVATQRVACGEAARDFLFGQDQPCTILPNGIEIGSFIRDRPTDHDWFCRELGVNPNTRLLLQVGRLDHQKNPNFSLLLMEALCERHSPPYHLVFVGKGKLEQSLEKAVRDKGIDQHVTLLGNRKDIPKIMSGSDILLLPSRYEGLPLVLIEAQASGLPAIVSNAVSTEADLKMGSVSFQSLNSRQDWIAAIATSFNSSTVLSSTDRVRRTVAAGYSVESNIAKLYWLYNIES